MRVLVTGGREYKGARALFIVLDRMHAETPITLLRHGACKKPNEGIEPPYEGADGIADDWALAKGVPLDRNPADWTRGSKGGPERNKRMLTKDPPPDIVVACPGGSGTHGTIELARKLRIKIVRVVA